jgi:hypothetical protein
MNATASIKPSALSLVWAVGYLVLGWSLIAPFVPAYFLAGWCNKANDWLIRRGNSHVEWFRAWRDGG